MDYRIFKDSKLQKIIEFKKKNFWSSEVDVDALNQMVLELNKGGWVVKTIIPNTTFFGQINSYSLLIELQNEKT